MKEKIKRTQLLELMNTFYKNPKSMAAKNLVDYLHHVQMAGRSSRYGQQNFIVNDEIIYGEDLISMLLDFYSILEIGIITQYIPSRLNVFLQREIIKHMDVGTVKSYSLTEYVSLLPTNLLYRLTSAEEAIYPGDNIAFLNSFFSIFLSIENYIAEHSLVHYFTATYTTDRVAGMYKNIFNPYFLISFHNEYPQRILNDENDFEFEEFRFFQGYMDFLDATEMIYDLLSDCKGLAQLETALANYYARFFTAGYATDLVELMKTLENDPNIANINNFDWREGETYIRNIENFVKKLSYIQDLISINTGELVYAD